MNAVKHTQKNICLIEPKFSMQSKMVQFDTIWLNQTNISVDLTKWLLYLKKFRKIFCQSNQTLCGSTKELAYYTADQLFG